MEAKKEAEEQRRWCWEDREEQRDRPRHGDGRKKTQVAGITTEKGPACRRYQSSGKVGMSEAHKGGHIRPGMSDFSVLFQCPGGTGR